MLEIHVVFKEEPQQKRGFWGLVLHTSQHLAHWDTALRFWGTGMSPPDRSKPRMVEVGKDL